MIRARSPRPTTVREAGAALGSVAPPQGVILTMCDTLRRDHLPMYGFKRDTTPNLYRQSCQKTSDFSFAGSDPDEPEPNNRGVGRRFRAAAADQGPAPPTHY